MTDGRHLTRRKSVIATQRPGRPGSAPFVTRRSTLTFSFICIVAGLVFQVLAAGDTTGAGAIGLLAALALAAALVCGVVAWIAGVVLALRAGSMLWLIVAVLPFFPLNSMVCAMFCPAGPPPGARR